MREKIGQQIAEIRLKRGLSLRQVAELTGLDNSNISKIEKGRYNVGIDILGKVCSALGCELKITEKED